MSAREGHAQDEGAGSVIAIALLAVVGLVAMTAVGVGAASIAQVRAQGAADLAALAAAHRSRDERALGGAGVEVAVCRLAADVATANKGSLEECALDGGGSVFVSVTVPTEWGSARASARAGTRGERRRAKSGPDKAETRS